MTDHLPECPAPSEYGGGEFHIYDERPCICARLRACEQRVRAEEQVWHWRQGVQAARDAVAALDRCPECAVDAALAAIDALRGER